MAAGEGCVSGWGGGPNYLRGGAGERNALWEEPLVDREGAGSLVEKGASCLIRGDRLQS